MGRLLSNPEGVASPKGLRLVLGQEYLRGVEGFVDNLVSEEDGNESTSSLSVIQTID